MPNNAPPSLASFVTSRTIIVPASGTVQNIGLTGSMFYCKSASGPFQLRFNNGEWFDFDVAFFFDLGEDIFTTLDLRAATGAASDITVTFFVSSRRVGTHMNVNASITATSNLVNVLSSCALETEIQLQVNSPSGAATQFAANATYFRRIVIIAQKSLDAKGGGNANAGNVYIGNSAAHQPIMLATGDTYTIEADAGGKRDLGSWYISSDIAGDGVSILGC